MIKEVIVVEGRDDITAVKQAIDAEVIATGGFGINKKVIDRIKEAQKRKGVIVLTDPDFAGEKIRSIIAKRVPGIKHAYIAQEDGIKGDDIGVENAKPEIIIEALKRAKMTEEEYREIYTSEDMFFFKLTGNEDSKKRRIILGKELGIGYGNSNQMLTRLNKYSIDIEEFKKAIKKIEKSIGEGK